MVVLTAKGNFGSVQKRVHFFQRLAASVPTLSSAVCILEITRGGQCTPAKVVSGRAGSDHKHGLTSDLLAFKRNPGFSD
jgi:hypothetical protein